MTHVPQINIVPGFERELKRDIGHSALLVLGVEGGLVLGIFLMAVVVFGFDLGTTSANTAALSISTPTIEQGAR